MLFWVEVGVERDVEVPMVVGMGEVAVHEGDDCGEEGEEEEREGGNGESGGRHRGLNNVQFFPMAAKKSVTAPNSPRLTCREK